MTVNSAGSITEEANLDAKTVTITAGGSYVQNYSNALSSVGGDPAAQWQGVLNQAMTDSLWYGSNYSSSDPALQNLANAILTTSSLRAASSPAPMCSSPLNI